MKFCIFNPDNDLALANGTPDYCAPQEIVVMQNDLWEMPEWWYNEEILPYKPNHEYSTREINMISSVDSWGWNLKLRKTLLGIGISSDIIPDENYIDYLRELSHRRSSILLLIALSKDLNYKNKLPEIPKEIFTLHDGIDFLFNNPDSLFKTPWSSSGKGIFWCSKMNKHELELRLEASLNKYGSIIAEKRFNKIQDFAMLFESEGNGNILFKGYSLFNADDKGAYISNTLLSDEKIKSKLTEYVDIEQLNNLEEILLKHLADLIGIYKGSIGIDMMIYEQDGLFMIHPCIEINFRKTMGRVARDFFDNFCSKDKDGSFHVSYKKEGIKSILDELLRLNPLVIKDGLIDKGFTAITSYNENTKFCIYAIIN